MVPNLVIAVHSFLDKRGNFESFQSHCINSLHGNLAGPCIAGNPLTVNTDKDLGITVFSLLKDCAPSRGMLGAIQR